MSVSRTNDRVMSVKLGIGETVVNVILYVHMLPDWAVRRKRSNPSGDRWVKSSGEFQKEKG